VRVATARQLEQHTKIAGPVKVAVTLTRNALLELEGSLYPADRHPSSCENNARLPQVVHNLASLHAMPDIQSKSNT